MAVPGLGERTRNHGRQMLASADIKGIGELTECYNCYNYLARHSRSRVVRWSGECKWQVASGE